MTPTYQAMLSLLATQGHQRIKSLLQNKRAFQEYLTANFLPAAEAEYPYERDSQQHQDDQMERISKLERAEAVWKEMTPDERALTQAAVLEMDSNLGPENFRLLDPAPEELLP